jgi:hypothetical protein
MEYIVVVFVRSKKRGLSKVSLNLNNVYKKDLGINPADIFEHFDHIARNKLEHRTIKVYVSDEEFKEIVSNIRKKVKDPLIDKTIDVHLSMNTKPIIQILKKEE